jgi:hypothetical protein
MSPSARTWIAAAAGFVVTGALAFLGGRAVHQPEQPPAELPPLEATRQVVVPIPVDPDSDFAALAIELSAQEIDSREIASDLEVTLDPGEPGEQGSAPVGGSRPAAHPETGEPGEPVLVDPADWPPSDTPPASDAALDECADGGEGCPEGVGGTILLAIREIPPLAGIASFNPPETRSSPYGWSPECPPMGVPGGSAYFGFATSRPAVIEFRYRAYPWSRGAYLAEGELEFVTPDDAEGPWNDWIADEAAPSDDPRSWITHCILIPDLPPASDYVTFVTYRDKYDGSVTAFNWQRPVPFEVADSRGFVPGEQRRPTFLLGFGIDDLRVGVTRTPEQRVEAVALPRGEPGDCNTGGDEGSIILGDGIRGRVMSETEIPREELTDPTYPFFPDHSVSTVLRVGLQEGTDYLLCLYWLGPGTSFDAAVVEIAEEVAVSTPEAYRPRFRFHGVTELFGEIDAVRVGIWPCGVTEFSLGPIRLGESQMFPEPVTMCTAEEDLTRLDRGIEIGAHIHDSFEDRWVSGGRFVRTNLECDGPCRLRLPEMALVPLPEVPTERRLCGSGFGGGCDGEVPMRSAGFAVIEIQYIDVPGNGLARWSIGEAAEFEDTPTQPEGETPRLDPQVSYELISHPISGAAADITVVADRPVTLSASIIEGPDCGLGAPSEYSSETLATTHTFRIAPLCLGNAYELEVVAFDGAGAQGTVVMRALGELGPIRPMVVPPLWTFLDITVTIPSPDADHLHTVYVRPVSVAVPTVVPPYGTRLGWSWPLEDRAVAERNGWQMFGLGGQANACGQPDARPLTVNGSNLSWGALLPQDQITLRLEIDVHQNRPESSVSTECAVADLEVAHVLQATLTLAQLFEGITITSEGGAVFDISARSYRRELVGGS